MTELKFKRTETKKRSQINIKNLQIGNGGFLLAAGPCAIENEEQYFETARLVKKAGANAIRGSVFKPRTSPHSFQGLGRDGLHLIRDIGEELNIVVETEVTDPRDVKYVSQHVDIVRIGARNMQNFDLLKEAAKCDIPIILKRGLSSTYKEWLYAAEYLMMEGNEQVILCERGIRTFETELRNTLDLAGVKYLQKLTHLPIIVDPSHATGDPDLIIPMSKAAIASSADGLIIEVHRNPTEALCDGKQSLSPNQFTHLIEEIKPYLKIEQKFLKGE